MSKKNLPNIPLYIGDWERDCNVLSLEAEMAWMKIIFKMHLSGKQSTYRTSTKGLQILWKSSKEKVQEFLDELKFNKICEITEITGGYIFKSRRLEKENNLSNIRSEARKKGHEYNVDKQKEKKTSTKPLQKGDKKLQNTEDEDDYEIDNENEINNDFVIKATEIEFKEIVNIFNGVCKNLPQVQKITENRKNAIQTIIDEYGHQTLGEVFDQVSKSKFLNGDNERGWKADFDWILNPNNFIKILEKKYINNEKSISNNQGYTASKNLTSRIAIKVQS